MPRSRRTNPWLRYLDNFRVDHGRVYRWRPKELVRNAAMTWRRMTINEKREASRGQSPVIQVAAVPPVPPNQQHHPTEANPPPQDRSNQVEANVVQMKTEPAT